MPRARFLFLFRTFRLLIFHRFQLDKRLAELPCVPFLIYFIHNPHCLAKCFSVFVLLGATWKIFFSSFHHSSEVSLFRRPSVRAVNICDAASASDKDNRSASVGHESQTNRLRPSNVRFSVSRICVCVSVRRVCVVRLWPQSPRGPKKTFITLAANPPSPLCFGHMCVHSHTPIGVRVTGHSDWMDAKLQWPIGSEVQVFFWVGWNFCFPISAAANLHFLPFNSWYYKKNVTFRKKRNTK